MTHGPIADTSLEKELVRAFWLFGKWNSLTMGRISLRNDP